MARQFDIPVIYRSQIISKIKLERKLKDKYKKDFSPSILDLGEIIIKISRHFGFCYGVENAIHFLKSLSRLSSLGGDSGAFPRLPCKGRSGERLNAIVCVQDGSNVKKSPVSLCIYSISFAFIEDRLYNTHIRMDNICF